MHTHLSVQHSLTPDEHRLLVEWNATAADYPRTFCLHQLLEARAEEVADRLAVVCEDAHLTYGELNERANRLAHYLRAQGVGPDVLVGLCLSRSLDLVVALLGILKAGGAYVPLDPAYPLPRLAFLVRDARLPVLLTQASLVDLLPASSARVICLDAIRDALAAEQPANPVHTGSPEDLAYVIYTSGSTGTPKGVQVPHRALINCLWSMKQRPGLTEADVLFAVTSLSFDIAALEMFLPLLVGARLVVAGRDVAADGARLADALVRCGATVMQATPATWRLLLEAGWQGGVHFKVLCGGEALPPRLARPLLDRAGSVWNLYGPTETTIWSTVAQVTGAERRIPIGRPIANTRIYLLDVHLQPVPMGTPGELYIGGDGLARGYLDRPTLTAERFLPDPFAEMPGARLYRTGDLACWRQDGTLDFLGRLDQQVKIDGHRIEPGEIETVLGEHPAVRNVAVTAREDGAGQKRLVAYVVARPQPPAAELRRFLSAKLPRHLVPAAFVALDALPLTPNGKVDWQALPAPTRLTASSEGLPAPRTLLERQLQRLWEEVLDTGPLGVHDDFFECGGDSLLALRLVLLVRQTLGRELPLSALHQGATIERLAGLLAPKRTFRAPNFLVPIRPDGSRPPLFLVHGIGGAVLGYTPLARLLGDDQPVHGFQARGLDGQDEPLTQVEAMASLYVDEVRAHWPHGPYSLAGYSFGGLVAFEMAQQLHAAGQEVAFLGLIDEKCPRAGRRRLADWLRGAPPALLDYLAQQSVGSLAGHAARVVRRLGKRLLGRLRPLGMGTPPVSFADVYDTSAVPDSCHRIWEAHYQAEERYVPRVYPGRFTLFRARVQPFLGPHDATLGWSGLAAEGVEVCSVPGNHGTLLREPHLRVLAEQLRYRLASTGSILPTLRAA